MCIGKSKMNSLYYYVLTNTFLGNANGMNLLYMYQKEQLHYIQICLNGKI